MKIGVVGAREGRTESEVYEVLWHFIKNEDTIISGGARGVDTYARNFALLNSIAYMEYLPSPELYAGMNPYAGRNKKIAQECDVLLAFPTESPGTNMTIRFAMEAGKRVIVFKR